MLARTHIRAEWETARPQRRTFESNGRERPRALITEKL